MSSSLCIITITEYTSDVKTFAETFVTDKKNPPSRMCNV